MVSCTSVQNNERINFFVLTLDGIWRQTTSINCTNKIKIYINITFSILTFQQTFDQVRQRWLWIFPSHEPIHLKFRPGPLPTIVLFSEFSWVNESFEYLTVWWKSKYYLSTKSLGNCGQCSGVVIGNDWLVFTCSGCPGRQLPSLPPASCSSPWLPGGHLPVCQPPSAASGQISRRTRL